MLPFARKGFSAEEVKNALHGVYAPVQMRFRYDLLDADNNYIRKLDNVLDGEIACNSLAHIKRTAKFSLKETVPDKPFEIGGRNYKTETSNVFKSVTFSGWQLYLTPYTTIGSLIKEGDTVTGRFYIKPTAEITTIMLHFQKSDGTYGQFIGNNWISGGSEGYVYVTCVVPNSATELRVSLRHSSGTAPSDTVQYKEVKLEQGNKATDWSPAPEDQGYQTWLAEQKQKWMRETEQIDYLSDRIQPFVELKVPEIKRKHDDYALAFDGVDDYVDCENSSLFMPDSITVEGWIKLTDTSSWMLIDKARGGTSGAYYIYGGSNTNGVWSIFGADGSRYDTQIGYLELNTWYHLVGTFDSGTGTSKAYKNGVLIGETAGASLGTNTDNVFIGRYASGYHVTGQINNVSIWNKALTQTEIQANMNKRLTGNEPNLVGLWRFNEGTGTIAKDSTPNGNDGTIYGAKYEKAGIELETIPSKYINFPLGIFLLSSPTRADQDNMIIRDIEAYDGLIVLKEDKFIDRYNISTGTNYVDAVIQILQSAGITKWNIEQTEKVLDTDIEFEPGKEKLFAINEILRQINYDGIKVDVYGYYSSAYYRSPAKRSAGYTYIDDSESVTLPGMSEEFDLTEAPNTFVVIRSNSEQAPLRSEYTNDRVDSPISTVNRGRTIVRYETVNDMADQQALDGYVQRIAAGASQIYGKITFETAIMPFHDIDDVLNVEYSRLGIKAKYAETKWSFPLQSGGTMSHELRKVVTV